MSQVDISAYMDPEHAPVFLDAAKRWDVFILVRASNPDSRQYAGKAGYTPKRLDCKAKTAKADVPKPPPYAGTYHLKGLVADPTIHPNAYPGRDVAKYWNDFRPLVYIPAPGEERMYLPAGLLYTIQMDPAHDHYGCVAFTKYGLATNLNYIYGDYDLYAIVSAKNPSQNIFVEETRLNMPHSRSPFLFDVQHYLNSRLGIPMIQHGSQEAYSEHTEDDIIIFWPDGVTITEARGQKAIEKLYETTFKGRTAKGKETPTFPHRGRFRRI